MAIGVNINIKGRFFDRAKVRKSVKSGTLKILRRAGGEVRKRAIFSIKRKPYGQISSPGSPPFDHAGYARARINRKRKKEGKPAVSKGIGVKSILFGLADNNESVIIGPVISNSAKGNGVLEALELGKRSRNAEGKSIKIGKRPFMGPALRTVTPSLPAAFRGIAQ